ncbi:aspartyl protease family 2 [Olea europaea subsp. europaea]|uniref:Aspartyl protease family 2 n=1 Tax=Olea europaea subsp. europaea TaxID=158383 RepID=A0A8S0TPL1_OLEEU|nr:aspartyl protease family 2 [Olea europaea subsp. europaea]
MAVISISSCLLIFFFLVAATLPDLPSAYLKLPLLRKNPYPPAPSEALFADSRRVSALYSALHQRHRHFHAKLPITSAASFGSGQYLVSVHLGTPPQRLLLVTDTGSDLTWVTCSACRQNCSSRATFFPRQSTTFSPYHCFDSSCKLVPHPREHVPCNHSRLHSTCRYEYSYSDGSVSRGFYSHETTTFNSSSGKLVQFQYLSFGCGFNNSGPSVSGPSFNGANGVMGLGRGPISFFSQLGRQFGHKFSYCLMDYTLSPPSTSYLLIGGSKYRGAKRYKLSFTPLLSNPLSPTFYYIGIDSVFVNNVKLHISPSVWAIDELGNGGTVVDSGTTLTFLKEPAYRIILATVDRLVKLPKSVEPSLGFDLCFNVSNELRPSLPRLSFKLGGGSLFAPPPRNYFIDAADGVKCLALQPVKPSSGFSVIGNLMQQGYTFEFDKDRMRLGYSRHGCAGPS